MMRAMSFLRALSVLASQRPTRPPRAVASPDRVTRHRYESVPVTWIDEHLAERGVLVHLHGGAFVLGESREHWEWLEEVGRRAGAAVAMVHYRLAPRFPYPAAIDDVLHALDGLGAAARLRPGRWVLSGDSSGGGLALAIAQSLAAQGGDEPALLLLESPWVDLAAHLDDETDLGTAVRLYAGAVPVDSPRLSPLQGELAGLPPVHLVTGGQDRELGGESRELAARLRGAGVPLEEMVLPGEGHLPAISGRGPASQEARRSQIEAVRRALTAPAVA